MLACLPTPYPDELLYSILARYHVRRGNTSPKITQSELLGSDTISAVIDLPCGIDDLVSKIPIQYNLTAKNLILNHTLFPYYTAFLSNERANSLWESMKSSYGGAIHLSSGIMASSVSTPRYLKFCPRCNEEAYEKFGEYYWNRLHQLPGIFTCYKHKIWLQNSTVSTQKYHKQAYIMPDIENCKVKPQLLSISPSDMERNVLLSRDSVLLFLYYDQVKARGNLNDEYVTALKNRGLASPNGRVYQREFVESFIQYYGLSFLSSVESSIEHNSQSNWLSSIVRKHRKAFHPIRHLLLIRYLTDSLEVFFELKHTYIPFGEGPWICLNLAADHHLQRVINDVEITQCADTKLPIGTFTCSCGFIYSRRGPDSNKDDEFRIGRIKNFGLVWENELRRLVLEEKLGLREISRRLKVDPNTVKKYVSGLTLDKPTKAYDQDLDEALRNTKRMLWNDLVKENPTLSTTKLRNLAKGVYSWLYKYDKDWLKENSPVSRPSNNNKDRSDWNKRDKEILKLVKKAVESINDELKPQRITVSLIGKKIGALNLLQKHLNKMPLSKKYTATVAESILVFQIRRIQWAANTIISNGEELKKWKILRLAGIKSSEQDKFSELIERIVSNVEKGDMMKKEEIH